MKIIISHDDSCHTLRCQLLDYHCHGLNLAVIFRFPPYSYFFRPNRLENFPLYSFVCYVVLLFYDIYSKYPPYSFIWPYSFNWHLRVHCFFGNHSNHESWVPFMPPNYWSLIFIGMKKKNSISELKLGGF